MDPVSAAIIIGVSAGKYCKYAIQRHGLKKGDAEIEAERQREREEEANLENEKWPLKSLQHFTHIHELDGIDPQSFSTTGDCQICFLPVTLGSAYICSPCGYYIHQVCAKDLAHNIHLTNETQRSSDQSTILTFAHREHYVKEVYSNVTFSCNHCFGSGYGRRFRCDGCAIDIHPVCATSPTKISSFMHPQHDLELMTRGHFSKCDICHRKEKSNIRMYRCKECGFDVHPSCSQLPQHLVHGLHSMHPLILKLATITRNCEAMCGSNCSKKRWCYECKICNVSLHIKCIAKHASRGTSSSMSVGETLAQQALEKIAGILFGEE